MLKPEQNLQNYIITAVCFMLSFFIGYLSGDIIVGSILVATGLLGSYFGGIGKRIGYIFGFVNFLLIAYVSYINNLFGSSIVNAVVFAPLEIYGFISWSHNLDKTHSVKIRKFTLKTSLIVIFSCITGSFLFGYIFSLIPGQQLAFMDSAVSCLDICAIIILNLRYRESWALWVISGVITVALWIIAFGNGGENSFMRLVSALMALIMDTYAAIKWYTKSSKQKPVSFKSH